MRKPAAVAVAVAVGVVLGGLSISAQSTDAWVGKWRLNLLKSVYWPGPLPAVKNQIVTHDAVPNGIRTTIESIGADGTVGRTEITAMFDGKEYELKGAANPTTRVYRRIDDRSYEYVERVNGRVTVTTKVEISADGKTRTNTTTGTTPQGRKVHNVVISERQ